MVSINFPVTYNNLYSTEMKGQEVVNTTEPRDLVGQTVRAIEALEKVIGEFTGALDLWFFAVNLNALSRFLAPR